jgi:hypothetical protein
MALGRVDQRPAFDARGVVRMLASRERQRDRRNREEGQARAQDAGFALDPVRV